ncbi:MAG: acyl-CoA dehydrogenase family protein [Planctomycetota bacterium]
MHNLQLNEDQTLIVETVRKFVLDSVAPVAQERDEHRAFLRDELAGLAELGLFGLPIAEAHGGAGMGLVPMAAACEELGAHSGSLARLLTAQVQCAAALAAAGGGPLDEVLAGATLAAWIGLEHGVAFAGGKLTGSAELVPGAGEAALLVVAARDGDAVTLVTVDAGAAERAPLRALGFASTAPARVTFADTAATALANGDVAAAAAAQADLIAWIAGAAACVGMGRSAIELAHKHAGERVAFGKPLMRQQAVGRKLVESRRAIDGARHLVYHAARLRDLGEDARGAALAARIAAVDACVLAADEGIQIHGGFGYTVEYHVERHYRDAKTTEVLDGGNERCREQLAELQFS